MFKESGSRKGQRSFFSLSLSLSLCLMGVARRTAALISFAPRFQFIRNFTLFGDKFAARVVPPRNTFGDKVFTPVITENENMRTMAGIWMAGIIITL